MVMPTAFFSAVNLQKILFLASYTSKSQTQGLLYWLSWWILCDKNRSAVSNHCSDLRLIERDLTLWFKQGVFSSKLNKLFVLDPRYKKLNPNQHYIKIVNEVLNWFRIIDALRLNYSVSLEIDLIKLLGLALTLLNVFTAQEDECDDLTENEKVLILQGYYFWLLIKYQDAPDSLALLQNSTADLNRSVKKRSWRYAYESPLSKRLECGLDYKTQACGLFLEYWLAYNNPGEGLRGIREQERQPGTEFLIPPSDFMLKHRKELVELDKKYAKLAGITPPVARHRWWCWF